MSPRKVPVFLEPSKNRRIVVFGGGQVAYRKCRQFEGFHITVIADRTVPEIGGVCDEVVLKRFTPDEIPALAEGAFLVVAATDSKELNAAITKTARENGILTNSAHGGGDVLLPSTVRREGFTVAVSSEGSVPAFPPYVAEYIDEQLGEEFDVMLALLKELRSGLQDRVKEQPKRAEFLAEILHSDEVWAAISTDYDKALEIAREIEKRYH